MYLLAAVATRGSTSQVSLIFPTNRPDAVAAARARRYIHKCLGRCHQVPFQPRLNLFKFHGTCKLLLAVSILGCDPVPLHFPKTGYLASPTVFRFILLNFSGLCDIHIYCDHNILTTSFSSSRATLTNFCELPAVRIPASPI